MLRLICVGLAALNAGAYADNQWAVNAGFAALMALLALMPERES